MKFLDRLRPSSHIPLSNLIYSSVASLVTIGAGFGIQFLVTGHYGLDNLGIYAQAIAFCNILSTVAVFGLDTVAVKNIAQNRGDGSGINRALSSLLGLTAIISLFIFIVSGLAVYFFPSFISNAQVQRALFILLTTIPFASLNKILIATVNGLFKMKGYSILQICRYIGILSLLFVISAFKLNFIYIFFAYLLNEAALLLITMGYLLWLGLRLDFSGYKTYAKEQLTYAASIFFLMLLNILFGNIDIIMLGYFLPNKEVGNFGFALNIAKGFLLLPSIIQININPLIAQHVKDKNIGTLSKIVNELFRKNLLFVLAAAAGILIIYPIIPYKISHIEAPLVNVTIFSILILGFSVFSCYGFLGGFFVMAGRPKYQIMILVINITVLAASEPIFLLITGNPIGAATAIAIAYIVGAFGLRYFIKKVYSIDF